MYLLILYKKTVQQKPYYFFCSHDSNLEQCVSCASTRVFSRIIAHWYSDTNVSLMAGFPDLMYRSANCSPLQSHNFMKTTILLCSFLWYVFQILNSPWIFATLLLVHQFHFNKWTEISRFTVQVAANSVLEKVQETNSQFNLHRLTFKLKSTIV